MLFLPLNHITNHISARVGVAIAIVQLALLSSQALAGGYSYPGLGSAALSRGGAFVARADDPTAIWYNPAGAALHAPGTHILLDANIFNETFRYQRRIYPISGAEPNVVVPVDRYPHDNAIRLPEVKSTDGPMIIPFLAVVSDLGGSLRPLSLRLLAGVYGPNAHPDRSYPRYCMPGAKLLECVPSDQPTNLPGPSRYDTVATSILVLNPSVGLAWQPLESLSFGAVFQAAYASFSLSKVVIGFVSYAHGQPLENPGQDIDIQIDAEDLFTPSGAFGVHWRATSFLELGASVQLPLTHEAEGTVSVDLPKDLTKLGIGTTSPAAVKVQIPFPWIVRAGARYINRDGLGRERFDLEVDFVWESTSRLDQLTVETDAALKLSKAPGVKPYPLQALSQEYRWKDTWGVRAGGSCSLHGLFGQIVLILRAGFFYESSAAPDEYLRLDFMPLERMGATAGVGVHWSRFRFDLGYAHLFHTRRDIAPDGGDPRSGQCATSSGSSGCGSKAVVVIPIAPYAGYPVGNGTYDLSVDLFTLGATVSF